MSGEREYNFDGIVGPTHNYAGLSPGNLASTQNRNAVSNPRAAALEGIAKMRTLQRLAVPQAVLPPHERPHVPTLRKLGFSGTDAQVIERANRENPALLAACSSASAMWAANAATVSPSADTHDGRVHFTPANLCGLLHRSIEAPTTARVLRAIFSDEQYFAHHDPLPATATLGDEGAANHMRFANGLEVFVYGRDAAGGLMPAKYPARQTRQASEAIARLHGLKNVRFVQQNPAAIDAGAFHNDVVAVSHGNVLFCHEEAFAESLKIPGVQITLVPKTAVPLSDTVQSYLFNSQLVMARGKLTLFMPSESRQNKAVLSFFASGGALVERIWWVDVRQSMRNGGGPACLRLRVSLNDAERTAVKANVFFDERLHAQLIEWVEKHYRESLSPAELSDPKLLIESRHALDELSALLGLKNVYEFQM
jgi:succinylarginine dihydrolase